MDEEMTPGERKVYLVDRTTGQVIPTRDIPLHLANIAPHAARTVDVVTMIVETVTPASTYVDGNRGGQ